MRPGDLLGETFEIERLAASGGMGEIYRAMEWLEGEDLSRRLARGALRVDDALTLVTSVAEALAEAHAALDLLSPVPLDRIAAAATLAAILLAQGNVAEALAVAEDAAAKHAAMRGCGLFRGVFVRLVHAEVLHGAGYRERVGAAIAAARERLGMIAEIADPELRRSFLEVVPENARTLALAREWLDDAA